jgi:hypothetical protein
MAKVQGESQQRNGGRSYCNEKCAISVLSLSNRLAEADPEIGHDVQTIKRRLANFTHLGRQSPPHYSFLGIIGSTADTIIGDAWLEHAQQGLEKNFERAKSGSRCNPTRRVTRIRLCNCNETWP